MWRLLDAGGGGEEKGQGQKFVREDMVELGLHP